MSDHDAYFEYLKGRSISGLFYRRLLLYPRLCRNIRGRALDVGCGLGDMLAYRPNTIGVDVNPRTVAFCQKRGLEVHLMTGSAIPFSEQSFDAAVLDNVLEHVADPVPLLTELRRILKPGGALLVGVPGERGYQSDADHKVFYDETKLVTVLRGARFACSRIFHVPWRSATLSRRMRQYCIYGVFVRS